MDLQTIANGVLAYLVAPGVIVAIAAYLVKLSLEHSLSNSAKKYQDQLERAAFAYQTKFSSYHQKQAEVISELYTLLVDAIIQSKVLVQGIVPPTWVVSKEQFKKSMDTANIATGYYLRNRIYLEKDMCDLMDKIIGMYYGGFGKYDFPNGSFGNANKNKQWVEDFSSIIDEIKLAQKLLEQQLRKVLSPTV